MKWEVIFLAQPISNSGDHVFLGGYGKIVLSRLQGSTVTVHISSFVWDVTKQTVLDTVTVTHCDSECMQAVTDCTKTTPPKKRVSDMDLKANFSFTAMSCCLRDDLSSSSLKLNALFLQTGKICWLQQERMLTVAQFNLFVVRIWESQGPMSLWQSWRWNIEGLK